MLGLRGSAGLPPAAASRGHSLPCCSSFSRRWRLLLAELRLWGTRALVWFLGSRAQAQIAVGRGLAAPGDVGSSRTRGRKCLLHWQADSYRWASRGAPSSTLRLPRNAVHAGERGRTRAAPFLVIYQFSSVPQSHPTLCDTMNCGGIMSWYSANFQRDFFFF